MRRYSPTSPLIRKGHTSIIRDATSAMIPPSDHIRGQCRNFVPGQFPHPSLLQWAESHAPDRQTVKADDRIAESVEHAPELPVLPLPDDDPADARVVRVDPDLRGKAT